MKTMAVTNKQPIQMDKILEEKETFLFWFYSEKSRFFT